MRQTGVVPAGEVPVEVTLMRGGTSKGVFLRESSLPSPGPGRNAFVLALMGSPDPMQLDGLGGTHSSTSKLMAVRQAASDDADVEFLFAQVGVDEPIVDYSGTCGNLTAAVALYALEEGLVEARGADQPVRLLSLNSGIQVEALVRELSGSAGEDGVPRSGASIVTYFRDPTGTVLGSAFPLGARSRQVEGLDGAVEVTLMDVGHPVAFIRAADVGIDPSMPVAALNADHELLSRLESIRGVLATELGLAPSAPQAHRASPTVPRLAAVSPPTTDEAHLSVLSVTMGRVHHAVPITVALCTAAAATLSGTIPNAVGGLPADVAGRHRMCLQHPRGMTELHVELVDDGGEMVVGSVGVERTARRLLDGTAYVPAPTSSDGGQS